MLTMCISFTKGSLKLKARSLGQALVLRLLLLSLLTTVGSYNTASYGDGSNSNGDSSLCRVVRNTRKQLLVSFRNEYTAQNFHCDLNNHCANVSCSADFSRSKVNAGVNFGLCEDDPKVDYWVNLPQWVEPWTHTFSSKDVNGQRVEIIGNRNGSLSQSKSTRWFITVTFSITNGRLQINNSSKHISIHSVLQICQNEIESSCTNTTLLDFPRLPQDQICYVDEESSQHDSENGDSPHGSSSRSSRNANAWNPQVMHQVGAERAKKFQNGRPLPPTPGDLCDLQNIFDCGPGGSCVLNPAGTGGTCHCLPGFSVNATTNVCVRIPSSPAPVFPTDSGDSDSSRSYSSAIGAIISILILVTVAAGVFFGTKYHYLSRLRHRIPVLRCWPFRRHTPWEDNVTMVNPLGPPEDDDPPLL